ncbi:Xylose isomerase domain-containing protein TIM barrel (plasmid) [Gemmatirosa kalamazoonensis]|uniref:Xylose isomerase domain-containing protein TIM barrel n=1 Tax=Gemmatirosa kalamazoonensis TaxID=861299 RepID=W0RR62_9BACT|nr:sugar phosphate isomerase/epimerase family protein [Gemmatirosa kalamazoonensis]AHG93176.1 Xylose isomerase domain-containing protein TIM barrel [Gemmatirosa kalamazoonensis]
MSARPYRLGYNTNGFAHHRLEDALAIIAELGYRAVALTPDANHLPPDRTSAADLRAVRSLLERLDLAVVVETGARYVLDPRRKHRPTLLERDPADRARRLDFLVRCAEIASELGGDCVSFWSGIPAPGVSRDEAWSWLVDGVAEVCRRVEPLGVRPAFEPEPGMLAESLADWAALRDAVSSPALGLVLDVGHVPCTESITAGDAIRRHGAELRTLHLDDSRGGVHEHLQIGEGELDWPDIARALREVGFTGVAAFELSRHSHAAPDAARVAIERFLAADRH